MTGKESANDFLWTCQEEPHRTRRKEIIKAHPEVTKLCGPEPRTIYVVGSVVLLQLSIALYFRNHKSLSWPVLITAYIIGGTANQNIFMAIHELSHNLGFKSPFANRLAAALVNLPIGLPYAASFRPYHLMHHKHLGHDQYDTDLPTKLEAIVLDSVMGKAVFATFQLLFYAIRPMCVASIPIGWWHLFNLAYQLTADYLIVKYFGWTPLIYFLLSSFFAGSLHPLAGHFIAEHYVLNLPAAKKLPESLKDTPPPDTYSYYGPLNIFVYNVGYHNEHHDFPYIPWTRLPTLRKIAPEFYDPLPSYNSWTKVIWDFIFIDSNSLWCRVRREQTKNVQVSSNIVDGNLF
ncbi:hypothetical protein CANCADRAFT_1731 [Tortispora caseinolytica NRRL Y-17796]|uniref:Sphingolipid delta(4)-desaturase n=1 Tax=Tortispora caseinolytica NRRL Y-17796 TaxID=767744 RepID=A0A1E4TE26_9ASCO|nr:hypothetical protein CANCADRAFT_1731 [Tortispora caseinolytica NRRL Y-17796]